MRACWSRTLFVLVLFIGWAQSAAAEFGMEFGVESFRWREFEAGRRLLEESGPRYRLGLNWLSPLGGNPWHAIELRGALYFGSVDYDGQACTLSGMCIPFQTDTDYLGVSGEVSFIRRITVAANGEIFVGGGIDSWERDVQGRDNVAGAVESWTVFYLMGGTGDTVERGGQPPSAAGGRQVPLLHL